MLVASFLRWYCMLALIFLHVNGIYALFYLYPAIHPLPVRLALIREGGVVLVAKVQHSCAVCVCCHRSGVVGKRNKRATLSLSLASKNCRRHAYRSDAPRTRGRGCIQSAVAARACEVCSYKVHSIALEVSWNTWLE